MTRRDWLLLILTAVVAASAFLTPSQRDLFVGDETKYGRIIWELRQNHSLLVPTLEGRPYAHKPPVHFWMVYLLTYVFGVKTIWPFVLPSLVMFVLMLLLIARISSELFGGNGLLAAFMFSTFYLAWGLSQTARMDMTFVLLTSYAALQVYRSRVPRPSSSVRHLMIAAVAVGLAILIKGPMAFVTIATLILIERILARRGTRDEGRATFRAKHYVAAALVAAAIPLLWLIPALIKGGRDYSEEIIVKQNIGRAVGAWVHREPPWWYLQRFPVTFFPWFFMLIMALVALWRTRRSSLTTHHHSSLFCVSWLLAVLIPYSLLSSKLDVYMLSALVPAALLCAWFADAPAEERAARVAITGNRVVLVLLAAFFLTIVLLAPRYADQVPELELLRRPLVAGLFWSTAAVAVIALIWQTARSGTRDPGPGTIPAQLFRSAVALGVGAIFPMIYLAAFLMPVVNDASSTRPLVNALRKQTEDGRRVGLWQAPHLWTSDMPPSYRHVEYLGRDRLRQPGEKPLVIATRTDRAHHLGRELLEQYRRVDQFRMRGKQFDVYRRR